MRWSWLPKIRCQVGMHLFEKPTDAALQRIIAEAKSRLTATSTTRIGQTATAEALRAELGETLTRDGLGLDHALGLLLEKIVPTCIDQGHPRSFAAIPSATTPAAAICDLLVSASGIFAGTWASGSGAIFAENQVLRWLADLAGLPRSAGGTFVSGGTLGTLAALVAARKKARKQGRCLGSGSIVATSEQAHFAVEESAAAVDGTLVCIPTDAAHRMTGETLEAALAQYSQAEIMAIVATVGTPNLGVVDDLESIAQFCRDRDIWLHIDGTYGFPAILAEGYRHLFAGSEHADSLSVDPHKWLFAPYDSCALLYRNAEDAIAAHRWSGTYLGSNTPVAPSLNDQSDPKNFALHLSRRPRGLPLWFSLSSHGTDAYRLAVESSLDLAQRVAKEIDARSELDLILSPPLSVLVFRRRNWKVNDYQQLSLRLQESGTAWFLPTTVDGRAAARLALINPKTTFDDVAVVLDAMR